jgi:hypothetical protein
MKRPRASGLLRRLRFSPGSSDLAGTVTGNHPPQPHYPVTARATATGQRAASHLLDRQWLRPAGDSLTGDAQRYCDAGAAWGSTAGFGDRQSRTPSLPCQSPNAACDNAVTDYSIRGRNEMPVTVLLPMKSSVRWLALSADFPEVLSRGARRLFRSLSCPAVFVWHLSPHLSPGGVDPCSIRVAPQSACSIRVAPQSRIRVAPQSRRIEMPTVPTISSRRFAESARCAYTRDHLETRKAIRLRTVEAVKRLRWR